MNMDNVLDVADYIIKNDEFCFGKTFIKEIKKSGLEIGIKLTTEEAYRVYDYVRWS